MAGRAADPVADPAVAVGRAGQAAASAAPVAVVDSAGRAVEEGDAAEGEGARADAEAEDNKAAGPREWGRCGACNG